LTSEYPALFEGQQVSNFLRHLQEATRATPSGDAVSYIPPSGGEIAEADYHHFVFGQRGSGKSSLLRQLERQVRRDGRASAWIDQEIFSNLSYPDVLVSAILELMQGVTTAVDGASDLLPEAAWWQRMFGLSTPARKDLNELHRELRESVTELERLKFAPLDRKLEWTVSGESSSSRKGGGSAKMRILTVNGEASSGAKQTHTMTETVEGSKEQYLERALTGYRQLLTRASRATGGGFIFVDDLYQIGRQSQPLVLGYLHRLVKDTDLWLKVGSIRYSTVTYRPGDPPRGMQVGHDAHEVPLDRGLRHFKSTQQFLEKILDAVAARSGVDTDALVTPEAKKRLVLAAGGVARDYLRLTSGAIAEARNRGVTNKSGSHRIIVEDVNKSAAALSPSKLLDLRKDEPQEAQALEQLVQRLTDFCRREKSAYFLVARDAGALTELFESETVPDRGSQRFNGWLLDVAELSAQRATVSMDFYGWEQREKRRNRKLIFADNEGQSNVEPVRAPSRPNRAGATPLPSDGQPALPFDS